MYININFKFKRGVIMTRKGKLNWVKKHIAINTLQKWAFDKIRKQEKRFGSDLFSDMLIVYLKKKSAKNKVVTQAIEATNKNFYQSLLKEFTEKAISKTAIHK